MTLQRESRRSRSETMHMSRTVTLVCAAATFILATAAAGVARAEPPKNVCNVEDLWAASVFGGVLSNGAVVFGIFNQAPPAPEDNDGSESFALATQLTLGLGNAAEGDKYHFRFQTVAVSSGATARGHGFLFVPASAPAAFVIAGKGTHPLGGSGVPPTPGSFKLSGNGMVECAAGEGTTAQAMVVVEYENGITDNNVFVNMVHCIPDGPCEPPGD